MKPYTDEFRAGSGGLRCQGGDTGGRASFKVSESWVRRIVQQRRETGQVAAKTTRDRTPVWQSWTEWLLNKLAARPDMYLRELQADLQAERGEKVSLQTVCNACRALEQTRKKRR